MRGDDNDDFRLAGIEFLLKRFEGGSCFCQFFRVLFPNTGNEDGRVGSDGAKDDHTLIIISRHVILKALPEESYDDGVRSFFAQRAQNDELLACYFAVMAMSEVGIRSSGSPRG